MGKSGRARGQGTVRRTGEGRRQRERRGGAWLVGSALLRPKSVPWYWTVLVPEYSSINSDVL
eukprot:1017173-Rhodomonas_salina.3